MGKVVSENTDKVQSKPWLYKPGQSGNPAGRPKGARNKLGEAFIEALYEDFQEFGKESICLVREEKTDVYIKVIASLMPKEMHVKVDPFEDLSDEQLIARARELGTFLSVFGVEPDSGRITAEEDPEQVIELQSVPEAKRVP